MVEMSEPPTQPTEPVRLYDAFDDAGRARLDDLVRLVDDGAYKEQVHVLLADEARAAGGLDA